MPLFHPTDHQIGLTKYLDTYYTKAMPNVSTYILHEDFDKYQAIHSKGRGAWTEFIHDMLNPTENLAYDNSFNDKMTPIVTDRGINRISKQMDESENPDHIFPVIKTAEDAKKVIRNRMIDTKKLDMPAVQALFKPCKIHGTPLDDRGRCLQKDCKYA